eukprot:tig00000385_g24737.t1
MWRSITRGSLPLAALALALVLLALAPRGASAAEAPVAVGAEILRLDCSARLHLFPQGFLNATLDLSRLVRGSGAAAVVMGKLKDRLKCMMEKEQAGSSALLTDEHWTAGWTLGPQALVNMLRGAARRGFSALPEALQKAMRKSYLGLPFSWNSWHGTSFPAQDWIPSTCSGAAGSPCLMSIDARATLGATLKVAYDLCPATGLPFLSVNCEGSACSRFLRPCSLLVEFASQADADCRADAADTGAVCLNVMEAPAPKYVFEFLKSLGMYDAGDKEELAGGVMKDVVDFVRSLHGIAPAPPSPHPFSPHPPFHPFRRRELSFKACVSTAPRIGLVSSNGVLSINASASETGWFFGSFDFFVTKFAAVAEYFAKDVMKCSTADDKTSCPQVSGWDGKLAGGLAAVSEARKAARDLSYSGPRIVIDKEAPVTKLLALDCEGALHVGLMNFGITLRVPVARPVAAWLGGYVKKLQAARYAARSASFDEKQAVYYQPWTAGYMLASFTNAAGKPARPALSSLAVTDDAAFFDVSGASCSMETLSSSGKGYCLANLAKFLPKGLRVEMALGQCGGQEAGLPALELGVSGPGADLFTMHKARRPRLPA